jgi:hypothetical protein
MRDTETSVKSETTEVRKVDCAVVVLERKNNEKIFRKPLDKSPQMWYNINVIKRGSPFYPSVEQMDAKTCAINFP